MTRDWWLLAVLFLMCKIVGILPVEWNTHINYCLHLCGQDKDCFSASRRWKLITVVQLVYLTYTGYAFFCSIPWNVLRSFGGAVFIVSKGSTMCSLLLVVFHDPQMLVQCCCMACKIYTLPLRYQRKIPLHLFILLAIYPFITIFYLVIYILLYDSTIDVFFTLLKSNYLYTPIATVEVVVAVFCLISSKAYIHLNKKMQKLTKINKKTFKQLTSLLNDHIFVSTFSKLFSDHFSPHFLNIFFVYILRMIWIAIILIQKVKAGQVMDVMPFGIHAAYATGRLFFLCHWCEKVKVELNETLVTFRYLRILWMDQLSDDQETLLDGYEELMQSCQVEFTACGMFPINLQQIINVLGLIATYSLVGLQTR